MEAFPPGGERTLYTETAQEMYWGRKPTELRRLEKIILTQLQPVFKYLWAGGVGFPSVYH